jgi:thiosulfate/3-mercaptopyruvate sulfurtransferase
MKFKGFFLFLNKIKKTGKLPRYSIMQEISAIIKPEELLLKNTPNIVLVDARAGLTAHDEYAKAHLDGALFVDLNTQLANIKPYPANGGRHPLPDVMKFAEVLTQLGITPNSHVVIYDDKSASNAAARFWWMLKSAGHNKVQVLDGGLDAAIKAGFQLSSKEESPLNTEPYKATKWLLPLADIDEVAKAANDEDFLVIDVRDKVRYDGDKEPIDLIAGHIPGAINIPFTSNLGPNGFYLSRSELRDKYLSVLNGRSIENVIVHCGSGVTACHTILAMAYSGIEFPKLYVGSWSEWSRNERPIATNGKAKT